MANIAESAGVSRPAVYQYFADKEDVFAAAFAGVFEARVTAAIDSMNAATSTILALDALLQRFEGDLWELVASSPHHHELVQAKSSAVASVVAVEVTRLWSAVGEFLKHTHPGTGAAHHERRSEWAAILRSSPGLRFDQPDAATFRRRLTALARTVASDIEACTS